MEKPKQKRTLKTHARLLEIAKTISADKGYGALRVEDVVKQAGVAKGTFFSHFKDKDALMDILIGEKINILMDEFENFDTAKNAAELGDQLLPLLNFVMSERYVFDIFIRLSGALENQEIGVITTSFGRIDQQLCKLIENGNFRKDASASLLAEGVMGLAVNAIALHFCDFHQDINMRDRFISYLNIWLK